MSGRRRSLDADGNDIDYLDNIGRLDNIDELIDDDNINELTFSAASDLKDFIAPSRDTNETEYFAALAQASLATDELPFIYRHRNRITKQQLGDDFDLEDPKIIKGERLFKLSSPDSGLIQPEDLDGVAGMTLCIRQLILLEQHHLATELRREMKNIAKNKMVGEAQVNKILALLKLYRNTGIQLSDYSTVRLLRVKELPNMFGRREDLSVENQDRHGSRPHNSREKGYEGAVRDWGVVDVPEGTERVRIEKKSSWLQKILLLRTNSTDPEMQAQLRDASRRYHKQEAMDLKILQHGLGRRLVMAITGALALVGPMLIMAIRPSLKKNLITVGVCVFVFAILMAWTPVKPSDVLAATAGYAAVLVVFTTGLS